MISPTISIIIPARSNGLHGLRRLESLDPRLEQVNRLDVLDAVGDRALAYFDAVPESQLTATELALRIGAIDQIGEVRYTQGNLPAALAAFQKSQALARDLAARDPANPDWQHLLWDVSSWAGQVHFDQRRLDEAQATWTADLGLARERRWPRPSSPSTAPPRRGRPSSSSARWAIGVPAWSARPDRNRLPAGGTDRALRL